ncbi:hypothetical protein [Streptosporangium sp. NPDC049376]
MTERPGEDGSPPPGVPVAEVMAGRNRGRICQTPRPRHRRPPRRDENGPA